jgi:hypothetical protein
VIRLKYVFANGSREFFDRVLKEYRKRYGEPDQWRGDPFHLVLAWKWAFVTVRGERLSLMLTHSDDDDSGRGSSVKLTNWTLWERERQCYERSHPPLGTDRPGPQGPAEPSEDLSRFLPQ